MSRFIVFRAEKHKSAISLMHSLKHAMREQPTPNADPDKLAENQYFYQGQEAQLVGGDTVEDSMALYRSKLPEKVRKNAVHCVEFLVGGSPEHMATLSKREQMAYFREAANLIATKMGGVKNVIHAQVHFDETTPHLTMFVVPIDERGKLNARRFIGGSKNVMRDWQTEIAEEVGKKYGFERGLAKSKPDNHIEIKDFYKILNSFDRFLTDSNLIPSDEFMDKLSKDLLMLMKQDETLEKIKEIKTQMASMRAKWNERFKESHFLHQDQYGNKVDPDFANKKHRERYSIHSYVVGNRDKVFDEESSKYQNFEWELNSLNLMVEQAEKAKHEVISKLNLKGPTGLFGLAKPADILSQFAEAYQKTLSNEVERRKKEKEREDKAKNQALEAERRALSDEKLKLEERYKAGIKGEIERIESDFNRKKDKLIDDYNGLVKKYNSLLVEKNSLEAEKNQLKQEMNAHVSMVQDNEKLRLELEALHNKFVEEKDKISTLQENLKSKDYVKSLLDKLEQEERVKQARLKPIFRPY